MGKRLFLVISLVISISSWAASQDVTGNLEGYVLDIDGTPIGGASVFVISPSLQGTRETATDEQGHFLLLLLPAGSYNVKIAHQAYQGADVRAVAVRLGRTTAIGEIRLKTRVSDAYEIVVSAQRPAIDPISTSAGSNLGAQAFQPLPVERNYRSISLLLPNATPSFLGDEGINLAGATGIENKYFVDGIDVTDPSAGRTGTNLPFNFIKEFELRTGGYEAEYRSSLGGIVNVITYSGGNEFSGQVFTYYSNNRLSGSPRLGELEPAQGGFSRYDFGLSLGGPIVRDKLWFFLAFDPTFEREDVTIPGLGFSPDKSRTHIFAGKLTWQASPRTSFVFTTVGDPGRRDGVGVFSGVYTLPKSLLNPDPYLSKIETGGTDFSLKSTHIFNDHAFMEATFSSLSSKYDLLPGTERGWDEPAFIDPENGIWSGGVPAYVTFHNGALTFSMKGTVRLADHLIKAGMEYQAKELDVSFIGQSLTRYSGDFYQLFISELAGTYRNRIPSLFIQDSWQLRRRLRVNLGLRWDGQYIVGSNGKVAQKILDQYQPRIGIIYEPGRLGTQRVYASFARFYHDLSLFAVSNYFTEEYIWKFTNYDHDPRIDPSGGSTSQMMPGIQPENEDLKGQHFDEFTLGYERLLFGNFKLGVRGIYRTLRQAVEDCVIDPVSFTFYWGNPGRGLLSDFPRATRRYTALELTLERPAGPRFSFSASYVLSRNYGNYTGLFTSSWGIAPNMTNQYDLQEMLINGTGLLPNDRPHVFKIFGSYRLPFGLTMGTSIIWMSGTPLSELGGTVLGGMWNSFIRQRGTAGRTPSILDMNFRVVYDLSRVTNTRWKQSVVLDIFHLASGRDPVTFDQVHYFGLDVNGNQAAPNPMYGLATSFFPPMSVRLGFEVGF